jgi:hypothetical protein
MSEVLVVFGILIVLLGLAAVARPSQLLALGRKITVTTWLRLIAFVFRVALGIIVIRVAPSTTFPLPMKVIGSLFIVSGFAALILGNELIQRILNWGLRRGPTAVVVGGLAGILIGALLIYAGW